MEKYKGSVKGSLEGASIGALRSRIGFREILYCCMYYKNPVVGSKAFWVQCLHRVPKSAKHIHLFVSVQGFVVRVFQGFLYKGLVTVLRGLSGAYAVLLGL